METTFLPDTIPYSPRIGTWVTWPDGTQLLSEVNAPRPLPKALKLLADIDLTNFSESFSFFDFIAMLQCFIDGNAVFTEDYATRYMLAMLIGIAQRQLLRKGEPQPNLIHI